MAEGTRAIRTLDCASKLRVHYLLPAALPDSFCDRFPDAEVRLDAFSKLVRGARDHFIVARPGVFHASGVVGETRFVVTYGKPGGAPPSAALAEVEGVLLQLGFGPIVAEAGCRQDP